MTDITELHCRPPGLAATRVRIGPELAGRAAAVARGHDPAGAFVLTDAAVAQLHGETGDLVLAGGEAVKRWAQLGELLETLSRAGLDRRGTLVAVGGGAIGDLGGLAASLHLRGIDLLMVPTTLLSMVDSSVGGKTAVNLSTGKNLVGTFWPAREVWIDPAWLATLSDAEFRSGLGEVAKIALGLDASLLERLATDSAALLDRDPAALRHTIEACLRAKIAVVERDPREGDARRLLNLGHTLGHALEAHADFRLPHGIAVARGLHAALDVAESLGSLAAEHASHGRQMLQALGFEPTPLPPASELLPFLARDKKRAGDVVQTVLPDAPGSSRICPLTPTEFLRRSGA